MAHYRYGFVVFCFFGVMAFYTGRTLKVILDYYGIMDYIQARLWLSTIWDFGIGFYAARFEIVARKLNMNYALVGAEVVSVGHYKNTNIKQR